MKTLTVGLGALLLLPAQAVGQSRCEFREVVELSGAAVGVVSIVAGSGSLEVAGRSGLDEVQVTATLCASDEDRLEALAVSLEPGSSRVRIETEYPKRRNSWGRSYARIDLVVEVPLGTDLDIHDGSGSMEISDVGDVRIEDGSGSMTVRGAGIVDVDDGSGEVEIWEVGSVRIEDGSGALEIVDVAGDVRVSDGSGGVDIRSVEGGVLVSDGSGGIDIEAVAGNVRIERMGSGSVSVQDVEGDFTVERGRRERIRYSDVRGELDLPPARRRSRSRN